MFHEGIENSFRRPTRSATAKDLVDKKIKDIIKSHNKIYILTKDDEFFLLKPKENNGLASVKINNFIDCLGKTVTNFAYSYNLETGITIIKYTTNWENTMLIEFSVDVDEDSDQSSEIEIDFYKIKPEI